jgi:hypothetical protein
MCCRSFVDIGLTTISSVWKTPSTRMPNWRSPTCVTTMKPSSVGAPAPPIRASTASSDGSAAAGRAGAAPGRLDALDACSAPALARRAPVRAPRSAGWRSAACPASTISAETIASVSGILMVMVVPFAGHRGDVDGAADGVDIGLHHIHADAAARDRRDGGGRREARRKMKRLICARSSLELGFRWPDRFSIALRLIARCRGRARHRRSR